MGAVMKISKKVMCSIISVNILLILIGYAASKTIIKNELNSNIKMTTEEKSKSLEYIIDEKKNRAINSVKWFENSEVLIKGISENNREDIIALGKKAINNFGLDYLVVTDINGKVIARAHEPDKFGDSIINQANIQNAIRGDTTVGIEEGAVVKLSIRAGCPIKDEQGKILGVISTGYVLSDEFVDEVNKTLGCNITIFDGMERVGTTLKDNEKRMTGTKLDDNEIQENVLKKGKSISKLMEISDKHYYSVYSPLLNVNDEIVGMSFVGVEAEVVDSLITQLTIYQSVIYFITLLLSLLILSFILKKYLTTPLSILVNFFKEISKGEGDLTKTMTITSNDEVGDVIKEFNIFISKLNNIISHVKEVSNIVRDETINLAKRVYCCNESMITISNVVSKISENMMGNAAAIEETTASGHEVEKASTMVAQSCLAASEQSIFANEITNEVSKSIKDIIMSIQNISDSSKEVIGKMSELQSLSKKINEIVTLITNISEETNLLSINASIEAARAGENGKGFGIVAEEVRRLAEESNEASNEIISLINEVQGNIKNTALKVENVSENINSGVNKAAIAEKRFEKISEAINIVSEKIHDIAAAAEQQAASMEQISGAMDEISGITVSTADDSYKMDTLVKGERKSMEEANAATQRVNEIINSLNLMISKFKTKK